MKLEDVKNALDFIQDRSIPAHQRHPILSVSDEAWDAVKTRENVTAAAQDTKQRRAQAKLELEQSKQELQRFRTMRRYTPLAPHEYQHLEQLQNRVDTNQRRFDAWDNAVKRGQRDLEKLDNRDKQKQERDTADNSSQPPASESGEVHVEAYNRSTGEVQAHTRSWPDGDPNNNFSSKTPGGGAVPPTKPSDKPGQTPEGEIETDGEPVEDRETVNSIRAPGPLDHDLNRGRLGGSGWPWEPIDPWSSGKGKKKKDKPPIAVNYIIKK